MHYQGVSQKGKKFCILHELGNKTQLGVWGHFEPFSEFSEQVQPDIKVLEIFTIFS